MSKAGALHTVEGSKQTRRSPRTYTHAVVADYDHASAIKAATRWTTEQANDSWDYSAMVATKKVGDRMKGCEGPQYDDSQYFRYTAEDIAKAKAFIAANPDRAAYIAAEIAERVEAIKSIADGTLQVLQWSQSQRNAEKAINTFAQRSGNRNVRVVPVQRKG